MGAHDRDDEIPVENLTDTEDFARDRLLKKTTSDLNSLYILSLKRLAPLMLLSLFLAESAVMFLLSALPPLPVLVETILDATILLLILFPIFYFFYYRPILLQYEERKKIIDQLSYSKERLSLTLEVFNDGFFDWNLASGESYFSPRAYRMLGYQPGEFAPDMERWQHLIHPEDQAEVAAQLADHIASRSGHYAAEHRLKTKSGDWLWVLARAQAVVRDDHGRALRMVGTHTDISARKETEAALRNSDAEIRSLAQRLLTRSEDEKKYLAQELHDEFGQWLTAFQLGVEMLRSHSYANEQDYQFQCSRLLKIVDRLEIDLRQICDQLRPLMLEHVGLSETLRWHINEFLLLDNSLRVVFTLTGEERHLSREIEIVCYRILQESLNNVVKHAHASRVEVLLEYQAERVSLRISDDGCGLGSAQSHGVEQIPSGYGLLGMRERAKAVGGQLTIESVEGQGTSIYLLIAIEKDAYGSH